MSPSPACFELVKSSEGLNLRAYRDVAGVWTIGFGHTGPEVTEGLVWTQQQADAQLETDLRTAAHGVDIEIHVPLSQGEYDALVSFVFNLGKGRLATSTLCSLLNKGHHVDAAAEFPRWAKAGQNIVKGLLVRRFKEALLFLEGK
jgi:lysozyme